MSRFSITRRLEIDAAHRIPDHASKCRHLHGHRYVIEAECEAPAVLEAGAERGMVMDFSFLKELMLRHIDAPCDHGLLASVDDTALLRRLAPDPGDADAWLTRLRGAVAREGFCATEDAALGGRLYVIDGPPTAEVLARHWYGRLAPAVSERSSGRAALASITVWETPNCRARYCE